MKSIRISDERFHHFLILQKVKGGKNSVEEYLKSKLKYKSGAGKRA